MAFDETLAARIREVLTRKRGVEERKMFGCVCFLLNGNALAGVWEDRLIACLGPDEGEPTPSIWPSGAFPSPRSISRPWRLSGLGSAPRANAITGVPDAAELERLMIGVASGSTASPEEREAVIGIIRRAFEQARLGQ